jgi:ABC-2 type transport system ATP-binding protein
MIELQHLTKEYDLPGGKAGTLVAADALDLRVPRGEVFGLVGPNGAGKTTTLKMLCGLLRPTAGRATVNGVDVERHPEQAQRHLGYLSDFFSVYDDLKVWEYVDYFARAYKMPPASVPARVKEVIRQVGLEGKRDSFISGLSRGMKQRLGIARAVIHQPKVLLLDEPASGLDPKARMDLRNLLRSLCDQGTTILISSHILTELEGFCTSIGLMEKGNMVRSGRIEEIVASASPVRVVRLGWARDGRVSAEARLRAIPNVSDVLVRDHDGVFKFAGSEDELSEVLAALVSAGIRVTSFGEVKQTVEDLYVKLSRNEVM